MTHTAEQLQSLIARCEQFRGAAAPSGYRDGLALCVIDSVQSTGVTYSSVESVVDRYRAYRRAQGGNPNSDGSEINLVSPNTPPITHTLPNAPTPASVVAATRPASTSATV